MNNKQQFAELAQKLVKLGENQNEFDFWLKIFDDLAEEKQRELIKMMLAELEQLEKIK